MMTRNRKSAGPRRDRGGRWTRSLWGRSTRHHRVPRSRAELGAAAV